jgi:hypothetical protein
MSETCEGGYTADAVTVDQLDALKRHFTSTHAGFVPGRTRHVKDNSRIPVVSTVITTLELHCPGQGQELVITADGSATSSPGHEKLGGCAAVTWDGRALVGWYQQPPDVRGEAVYAEWQALRLALRLAAASPGPVMLVSDNRTAAEQLRRVQRGKPLQHAFLSCRDQQTASEISRLATGLAFSVTCLDGGKRTADTAAVTGAGNAAHSLAFAARRLAESGIDPASELVFLEHIGGRVSRAQKPLTDSVDRRIAAIGRGEAVWTGSTPNPA